VNVLERIGAGLVAMNDPLPGPDVPSGLSDASRRVGGIRLVGSSGYARSASYRQVYLFNPFVYAAANLIARGVGRLPLHVFGLDANAEKQRFRADIPQTAGRPQAGVQLDRILSRNADGVAKMSFWGSTLRERLIYGNALWEILTPGGGLPSGLTRIPWRNVGHIEEDGYGNALYYEVSENGKPGTKRRLFPEQVIHFGRGSESDQATGISILESCHHTLALHEAVMRHLNAYFENSARGSGYFKVDTEKQAQEARKMITQLYTSPENAGKVLVTSGEWKSMADSPDHSHIVELITESRIEVAASFQVPPPVLGLLEHAIRANVKEMREQFVRDTIGPWASEMEDELEAQLLGRWTSWSSLFVEFELAEQLRPDLEARALVYQRLIFVFSIDEIRAMENKPPFKIKGVTDVPWAPSGAMPLTTAAKAKSGSVPAQEPSQDPVAAGREAVQVEEFLEDVEASRNGHHEVSEVT
jgi:HK97 family phage portal protein